MVKSFQIIGNFIYFSCRQRKTLLESFRTLMRNL